MTFTFIKPENKCNFFFPVSNEHINKFCKLFRSFEKAIGHGLQNPFSRYKIKVYLNARQKPSGSINLYAERSVIWAVCWDMIFLGLFFSGHNKNHRKSRTEKCNKKKEALTQIHLMSVPCLSVEISSIALIVVKHFYGIQKILHKKVCSLLLPFIVRRRAYCIYNIWHIWELYGGGCLYKTINKLEPVPRLAYFIVSSDLSRFDDYDAMVVSLSLTIPNHFTWWEF